MCALSTLSWLPLCTKICAHMTCFLPGMSLDYCCGLPLLNSATKTLCCNNPSLVMFILVVLPLPSHTAFVDVLACVQSCSGVTVTEVTAPCEHQHKCWHRCKWMLLPRELTYRNSSSPLPCVSALCFHLEPLSLRKGGDIGRWVILTAEAGIFERSSEEADQARL